MVNEVQSKAKEILKSMEEKYDEEGDMTKDFFEKGYMDAIRNKYLKPKPQDQTVPTAEQQPVAQAQPMEAPKQAAPVQPKPEVAAPVAQPQQQAPIVQEKPQQSQSPQIPKSWKEEHYPRYTKYVKSRADRFISEGFTPKGGIPRELSDEEEMQVRTMEKYLSYANDPADFIERLATANQWAQNEIHSKNPEAKKYNFDLGNHFRNSIMLRVDMDKEAREAASGVIRKYFERQLSQADIPNINEDYKDIIEDVSKDVNAAFLGGNMEGEYEQSMKMLGERLGGLIYEKHIHNPQLTIVEMKKEIKNLEAQLPNIPPEKQAKALELVENMKHEIRARVVLRYLNEALYDNFGMTLGMSKTGYSGRADKYAQRFGGAHKKPVAELAAHVRKSEEDDELLEDEEEIKKDYNYLIVRRE